MSASHISISPADARAYQAVIDVMLKAGNDDALVLDALDQLLRRSAAALFKLEGREYILSRVSALLEDIESAGSHEELWIK